MHNVESMFYTGREKPWHGLGTAVPEAPTSEDAIHLAGLDWDVISQPIFLENGSKIPDYFANVRTSDSKSLGIVGKQYKIVQNTEAFAFTDELLGEGVTYETAGSLKDGKIIWLLAKMPETYKVLGDDVEQYLVFTNTHDGSGAVKVAVTGIRVVCNNTLNMALRSAKRTWSARHTGNINSKLDEAKRTLELADKYIKATQDTFEELYKVKVNDFKVRSLINNIIPINEGMTDRQKANAETIRRDILFRYENAPDLVDREETGARFIQAVADMTSHIIPFRATKNYAENKFKATIDGNDTLDRAISLVLAA